MRAECFSFGPGLVLEVRGGPATLRHFRREYGPCAASRPADVGVAVTFDRTSAGHAEVIRGGHKSVRWTVEMGPAGGSRLEARIALLGAPLSFGRSLVQGYFVEPLLAVAAIRRACVLLSAAAVEQDGRALVLLGSSGVGKSTLMARAAATGRRVLGDDQVIVDASGACWPFPRRPRLYPDLRVTAPLAYRRLRARRRGELRLRGLVERLTRGYVAPSLAVAPGELGRVPDTSPLPVGRIVLIERDGGADELEPGTLSPDAGLGAAGEVIDAQRRHLGGAADGWPGELALTRRRELELLSGLFGAVPVERLAIPSGWGATRAVEALWQRLIVEREASHSISDASSRSPSSDSSTKASGAAGERSSDQVPGFR